VTSLTIEELHARNRRALGERRRRFDDALAGRTVWCITTLGAGEALAEALSTSLAGVDGVGTERLRLQAAAEILELAAQIASMTGGTAAHRLRALSLEASAAEPLGGVSPEDVVVVHDPLAAMLASGARERGAHVVWDETNEGVVVAWRLVREAAPPADAHLAVVPGVGIAAVMAAPSRVAAKHCEDVESAGLGRVAALADIVRDDRDETVGGTFHVRPVVAAR
jgi:hypothetical protein